MLRSITAIGGYSFATVLVALVLGAASPATSTTNLPPVVTLPGASFMTKATSPGGAVISYIAVATDDSAPAQIDCAPQSGTLFAVGTTVVRCTAADDMGATTTKAFAIYVKGAAEQIGDLVAVVQGLVPLSGVYNGLLDKLVTAQGATSQSDACRATNAFVNELRAQTGKKIDDAQARELLGSINDIRAALGCIDSAAAPVLFAPSGDITTSASPHLATGKVLYAATSATLGVVVTCDRPGPSYPIGRTLVTCRAALGGRMSTPASFAVVVIDNEAPQLTLPPDITAHAAVGRNSAEVTFAASAADNSGAVTVSCLPGSGSTFPLGTTAVNCAATDPSGNTTTGTFRVTVDLVITGRVTDSAGAPIPGTYVRVFLASAPFQAPQFRVALVQTDANGVYVAVVPSGSYKVLHGGFGTPYFEKWWHNRTSLADADVVDVAFSVGGIDAQLERGLFIRGHVTDAATGLPIQGVGVNLSDATRFCCFFAGGGGTDANGDYAILVRAGSYKVMFYSNDNTVGVYAPEWWDDQTSFAAAATITITTQDRPNIDAALAQGFVISGRVTALDTGAPIPNAFVNAQDATLPCCSLISFASTNLNGEYRLIVRSGTFKLVISPPNGSSYFGQWWDGKSGFDTADSLTITGDRPNVNAMLVRGVLVHGTVTDELTHAGIGGIDVGVSDANGPCCRGFNTNSRTNADGTYSVLVPKSIPVKLQFFTFSNPALPYIGEWYDNTPSFETATVRTFSTETFGIDAALTPAVVVHGTVTDELTHVGIGGVGVNVNDASVPCCRGIGGSQTGPDGTYSLPVPKGEPVKIFFGVPPDGPLLYVQEWYDNKAFFDVATTKTFATETFGIDAALTPAVLVHGTVTDELTHAGVGGVFVTANNGAAPCCLFINGTQTGAGGNYTLRVPKGQPVRIFFGVPPDGPLLYVQEWYDNQPGFDTATTRTFVTETFGIDAALTPAVVVHGTVTDEVTHTGIAGVFVNANDATAGCCLFVGGTQTGPDGSYRLLVPGDKPVKIQFVIFGPGAPPYVGEWYDDQPDFDHALSLTFTSETFGIDAALTQAVHVHGIVTDETTGIGIGRISIQAVDAAVPCCPFRNLANAQTDASGNYDMLVPKGRTVKIQFFVWRPDDPAYIGEWFDNQSDFDRANAVMFTTDNLLNVALAPAAVVHGTVTDRDTHAAIGHISIQAVDPAAPCCRGLAFAETDANGIYQMRVPKGLPVKIHFFVYRPDDPPYIGSWDADQISFELAAIRTFFADTEVDAALTRAFALGGTVTDRATGLPVAMIQIGVSDFTLSCCVTVTGTNTDSNGRWMVPIRGGIYRVWFGDDTLHRYAAEFWDREPDPAHADPVVVSGDRLGIDAELLPLP